MTSMRTGFFWVKERDRRQRTTVHIEHRGKPFCQSLLDERAFFVMCLPGVHLEFVECERCSSQYAAHVEEVLERVQADLEMTTEAA